MLTTAIILLPVIHCSANPGVNVRVEGRNDRIIQGEGHIVEGGDFSQEGHNSIDANLKSIQKNKQARIKSVAFECLGDNPT
jgi:O-acetyl-ADP-ribose deacetylase (regulator of RNase III)